MAYVHQNLKMKLEIKQRTILSLPSIVCKLMECLVKEPIMIHVRAENLFSTKQYGFTNGRSTTKKLFLYLDKCIDIIVAEGVVDTTCFDFAKTFTSITRHRVLGELKLYGANRRGLEKY